MEVIIGTILIVVYFLILLRFFPAGRRTMDVFKLNPHLLPYWWKFVGIGSLVIVLVYSVYQGNFDPLKNPLLLSGMYFSLLQMAFSKEKSEDEFIAQIRLKAMYVALISLFFLVGVYSSFELTNPKSFSANSYVWFMMLFNATLIVYLSYFYVTKYGVKK